MNVNTEPRVAIVTGAGTGIGRAVAIALVEDGYSVVLAGRREDVLHETRRMAGADETRVIAVATDISEPSSVARLFDVTKTTLGRLDLLFNNAGVNVAAPIDEVEIEDWRRSVDINLTGTFLCTQAAFRLMKQQTPRGGRIINNGSISAHVPRPNTSAYTATKHAITGLTRSTSLEGRRFNIACGQIDIGNAKTEMTARVEAGVLQADSETIASEPTFDAQHVGQAVVYMANLPLDTNVPFLTVMANGMPYMGRG